MTGQPFFFKELSLPRRKPLYIRALQGQSGKNLEKSTFSHKNIEKRQRAISVSCWILEKQDSMKSGGLVPGGFGTSKGRKAVYFSMASPFNPCADPKYKPYTHMKNCHDRKSVIDLEATQNSIFSTKQGTGCFML